MALWTNLLLQAANANDTTGTWSENGNFTVTAATSLIPGQTAWQHTNTGVISSRAQAVGTLTGSPETAVIVVENDDAVKSLIGIWDDTASAWVNLSSLTWSTGQASGESGGAGSAQSRAAVSLGTGPNGGAMYLLAITGTPSNPGNDRQVWLYPTNNGASSTTAIIHYAGLHEAATYSPAYIVTGAASVTARVIALDDYPILPPTRRYQDLATYRRRFDGSMSSTTRSPNATARVWDMETDIMTAAETDTLESELLEPGYVEAVGALIHDTTGVSVECRAQNVERIEGPLDDQARLRFALHEVGA